ncbi:hypothetical protein ONV78_16375 [Hahella sp. CR1]|uniref:hypothetical protein n=1 Tax=Hahella sp. CR1 TaxID=2992807 RepID=UPI002441D67D|nr:hypothetical protein [Hahella sp. CR1]MDG9669317.1 hypothetical protein [Hahella sp. CR1]
MEKIKFKCGTEVFFTDSILVRRTYSGLMVGRPDEEDNKRFLKMFMDMSEELMACVKPFVVPVELSYDEGYPKLPEYTCSVNLTHIMPAKDPNEDMSLAVIIWYQDENPVLHGLKIKDLVLNYTWSEVSHDGGW